MKNLLSFFLIICCIPFAVSAQSHLKKSTRGAKGQTANNDTSHQIKKYGAGEHGIFYDTTSRGIQPEDPANAAGRQYHDIKVTLDAGDAFAADLSTEDGKLTLALLGMVGGRLTPVKAFVDTGVLYHFKISYKSKPGGTYTLRVTCKGKAPKKGEGSSMFYDVDASYNLYSVIATSASTLIGANPSICEKLQFILRQRLTNYLQITGPITDTTFEDKKIQTINHDATFAFDKNSKATILVFADRSGALFDQMMGYKTSELTEKAGQYLIDFFKECLGSEWQGGINPTDATWYIFKREDYKDINVIIYAKDHRLEIFM